MRTQPAMRASAASIRANASAWPARYTVWAMSGLTWVPVIATRSGCATLPIPRPSASAVAWSAAFIMACARKTQAALQLPNPVLGHPTLTENSRHAAYCWQAFRDRTAGTRGRFWTFQPADALVEAGDIVAKTRDAVTVAQAWTATSAAAFNSFTSHCDIVVRIEGGNARVIGGNVGNSVSRTSYALTASGRINTTLAANDANRVFAVLKPMGGAFSGRLMGMIA